MKEVLMSTWETMISAKQDGIFAVWTAVHYKFKTHFTQAKQKLSGDNSIQTVPT